MKRLFLASSGLASIRDFVRKSPADLNMLFIPTAGNLDKDAWWIDKDREVLRGMGFAITELDIEHAAYRQLERALRLVDIVYVAGGNTFHLLDQIRRSGFDTLLTHHVNRGGMYAGASAGALIVGADIGPIASIDEPEKVTGLLSTTGLGFVNIIPIPHYDTKDKTKIDMIKNTFSDTYEIVLMTDDEAIIVEGDTVNIIASKRSEVELDWSKRHSQDLKGILL